jgi:uncharacterized protein YdeI (YjbR/CyaY-like superfamily)
MRPPGLLEVEAAKADGRWQAAYESQRTAAPPPDLLSALSANPKAEQAFSALSKSARYALILKVLTARTPKSRAAQLDRTIRTLEGS